MDSITEILRKLKDGEDVAICDIYSSIAMSGKQGDEQRLAALIGYATRFTFPEILGIPTVSRVVYPLGGDTFVVLSPDCRKISMVATGGNLRYILGDDFNFISDASQGHFILQNERLDVRLPEPVSGVSPAASPAIYVFGDGELYISELE